MKILDDAHVHAVRPVVGHGDRFGKALGFVVDAAGADGVDIAPVALGLGVLKGVAVDLAGRSQHQAGALGHGQAQSVVGPQAADLQRLDGQRQVVHRRRRAGKMEHGVHGPGDVYGFAHVVKDKAEALVGRQVGHIGAGPGYQVVDAHNRRTVAEKLLAQVRADEPGSPGDDHSCGREFHTRPTPSYDKPARRAAAGSRMLRASTMRWPPMRVRTLARSNQRNSSHSVRITRALASSQAS